jgi:hypothetical protein
LRDPQKELITPGVPSSCFSITYAVNGITKERLKTRTYLLYNYR